MSQNYHVKMRKRLNKMTVSVHNLDTFFIFNCPLLETIKIEDLNSEKFFNVQGRHSQTDLKWNHMALQKKVA